MAAKGVSSGDSVADRESASTTLNRVAGFDRNGWPACVGISGRLASDYALTSAERADLLEVERRWLSLARRGATESDGG
jgi:hypothetical protein